MTLGLQYRVLPNSESEALADAALSLTPDTSSRVLGAQLLSLNSSLPDASFPMQPVRMPRLGEVGAESVVADSAWSAELWLSDKDCERGEAGAIRYSCDGQLLYGTLEIKASDLPPIGTGPDAVSALQQASADAYSQIFTLLDAQGYPHLWRVWNYLADINAESEGLEFYRQFNVGRHQAFETYGRLQRQSVPAACALGTRDSEVPLSIAFLAAKQPSLTIENPRQVAAYEYPAEYGPRSPTFARAALAHLPGQTILFISGTASIVGHASLHAGDVLGQTRETLANIQSLLDEATRIEPHAIRPWSLQDLSYRTYLRHESDYLPVKALLAEVLGTDARIDFVQADVCRTDLLLEIEAVGLRPASDVFR